MVFKRRKRIKDFKRGQKLVNWAMAQGWDPVQGTREAIAAESGLLSRDGEGVYEYAARAAGVSVAAMKQCMQALERGETVDGIELAMAQSFIEKIGARLAAPSV